MDESKVLCTTAIGPASVALFEVLGFGIALEGGLYQANTYGIRGASRVRPDERDLVLEEVCNNTSALELSTALSKLVMVPLSVFMAEQVKGDEAAYPLEVSLLHLKLRSIMLDPSLWNFPCIGN